VKEPFLPFGGEGIIALKNKKILRSTMFATP
jgi:hypothetical protein